LRTNVTSDAEVARARRVEGIDGLDSLWFVSGLLLSFGGLEGASGRGKRKMIANCVDTRNFVKFKYIPWLQLVIGWISN
jgi:hypothetical protein